MEEKEGEKQSFFSIQVRRSGCHPLMPAQLLMVAPFLSRREKKNLHVISGWVQMPAAEGEMTSSSSSYELYLVCPLPIR